MGIFFILVIVFVIVQLIINILLRFEEGSPAKDKDILELFKKKGDSYDSITNNWDGKLTISSGNWREGIPKISRNSRWVLYYSYNIEGVGVVPRWYKSRKIIDAKFAELFKGSCYDTNKRKKLGLE